MEETLLNNRVTESQQNKLTFMHFPAYAKFITDNHFSDYVQELVNYFKEDALPAFRFFEGVSKEDLINISAESQKEFLTCVAENRLQDQLEQSLKRWTNDQLTVVGRDEIDIDDIVLGSHIKKKALFKFLPLYTTDVNEAIAIIKEIDIYDTELNKEATNLYIQFLNDRINEQTFFMDAISGTTPGLNYVFSLADEGIKYANQNYLNFSGLTLEQIKQAGTSVIENMVHSDDIAIVYDAMERCRVAIDKEVVSWEFRLKNMQDVYVPMRNYASVFRRDKQGLPTEIVGIILDIGKEKEIADKLLLKEQQLLEAQAQAQVGSFELDIDSGRMIVTPQFMKIYEVGDEFDINTILDKIHAEDKDRVNESRNKAIREEGTYNSEHRYIVNGQEKMLWSKGVVSYLNGRQIMTGTVMDITERSKMIQRLLDSEALYKQAQSISRIGNWKYDLQTDEWSWSDEIYHMYEVKPGGIPLKEARKYRHAEDEAHVKEQMRLLQEQRIPCDYNFRITLPSGSLKYMHVKGDVQCDRSGNIIALLGTMQDVTDQEIAEQALYQKNLQLQQSNTSLEEYAYVASHDLKEPLRKIATFSDRMLFTQAEKLDDEGRLYLTRIIDSSHRMQKMINDLLSVSTIFGDKAFELCDLNMLLAEALQVLDHKIEEKKAVISAIDLPTVSVVASQFRQLFQNLISNSLKFTREDVPANINITYTFTDDIATGQYGISKAKKYLQIKYADNGIGFDNQYAQKIFTIFQRLHSKSEYDGTGIGLALCKKIVENHGGVIYATGVVGEGATFTMIIPVASV